MPTGGLIINDSGATASHPYSLQIDGLDVIRQPGTAPIFGTLVDSITLHEKLGVPATLVFRVDDPSLVLKGTLHQGAVVYFADNAARTITTVDDVFRGFLQSARLSADVQKPVWECSAIGLETLLDRTIIPSGAMPIFMDFTAAVQSVMYQWGKGEIQARQRDLTAINVNFAWMETPSGGILQNAVSLSGKSLRQAIEDLARAASGYASYSAAGYSMQVRTDVQGRLLAAGATSLGQPGSTPKEGSAVAGNLAASNLVVDTDMAQIVNAVYVHGVDSVSSGWVLNVASINTYGRYEAYLDAPGALSSTSRGAIGTRYIQDRAPATTIHMTLADTQARIRTAVGGSTTPGWHVGVFAQLFSANGVFVNAATYALNEMTETWQAGGTYAEIEFTWAGYRKAMGTLLYQRDVEAASASSAAQRLVGTLGEVAVRSKAGIPTDADFDVPRDGFMVVDTTNNVLWIRMNGVWRPERGYQYDYAELTASTNITGTTAAAPTTLVTGNAVTYDGVTPVLIEFVADAVVLATPVNAFVTVGLYEDGTNIADISYAQANLAGVGLGAPMYAARKLTPTAASHTYSIRAYRDGGAGTAQILAGAGGNDVRTPAYIRITRV